MPQLTIRDKILFGAVIIFILFVCISKYARQDSATEQPKETEKVEQITEDEKPQPPVVRPEDNLLVKAHNEIRKDKKLAELQADEDLMKFAQKWAEHMAKTGIMRHQALGMEGFGLMGENIAMGYDSVEKVMRGWMTSPGHRSNILGKNWTHIGVGMAETKNGKKYWCVDFGRKRSADEPAEEGDMSWAIYEIGEK